MEWLERIFVPASKASSENRILLLLDNHSTRFTFEAIQAADKHGVDILPFPPNASHLMQPLDIGLFGPLKVLVELCWSEKMITPEIILDRVELIKTIMQPDVYNKAFTMVNIARGWREAGLHPFSMEAILTSRLTPDHVTKVTINVDESKASPYCVLYYLVLS